MPRYDETRARIIQGGMQVFRKNGPRFTMDDLAKEIGMSKKTIYVVFRDKATLLTQMVDYTFDEIKKGEEAVLADTSLDTVSKLRAILGVMPESFTEIDFTQIYSQREKFPEAYHRMLERLESGWETTIRVIREGIDAGQFREVDIPVFKIIFTAAIERFLSGSELADAKIDYMRALDELVSIMVNGIIKKD